MVNTFKIGRDVKEYIEYTLGFYPFEYKFFTNSQILKENWRFSSIERRKGVTYITFSNFN